VITYFVRSISGECVLVKVHPDGREEVVRQKQVRAGTQASVSDGDDEQRDQLELDL